MEKEKDVRLVIEQFLKYTELV